MGCPHEVAKTGEFLCHFCKELVWTLRLVTYLWLMHDKIMKLYFTFRRSCLKRIPVMTNLHFEFFTLLLLLSLACFFYSRRICVTQRFVLSCGMSVCPSVCHTGVLWRNNRAHRQAMQLALDCNQGTLVSALLICTISNDLHP